MAGDLAAAAAHFIKRYEWGWWCTLTFRGNPSSDYANKLFRCWMHKLNRKTFGNNYYKRGEGLRWIRGTELQKREAVHFHVLVSSDAVPSRAEAKAYWVKLAGDAKVAEYDPSRGAAYYLVKEYAANGNIDLGGTWSCVPPMLSGAAPKPTQCS